MVVSGELKVAVIGCGRMGAFTRPKLRERLGQQWLPLNHAEGVAATEGLRLVACCDIDESAALRAAQRYEVSAVFTDHREMLAMVKPDIVTIATRTPGRTEIIESACAAQVKGVYVEKPLSQNLASARRVAAIMRENDVAFSYGTQRRYMPIFRQAREIVSSGELGDIVQISINHGRSGLMWSHPHAVDILSFLAQDRPVDFVQADLTVPADTVEGNVIDADPVINAAIIKFRNGPIGLITSAGGMSVVISGARGTLTVHGDGSWLEKQSLQVSRPGAPAPPAPPRIIETTGPIFSGLVVALCELRDAIRLGTCPSLTPGQVVDQQATLFGFAMSHLSGGMRIGLDAVDLDLTITGRQDGLAV
ncbi:MAG: Gfo/Idh/MocA family oxidoreductase [Proteobacteria bacterium]|nr:Gfo/Idh/MocA family oxidoreductase [Pseudomonadota bacterium]